MCSKYCAINLRSYLDSESSSFMPEDELHSLLAEFSTPQNEDVEQFLHRNAVLFTQKSQSVTYLVFNNETADFVGYFTLTVKPLTIKADCISKSSAKKLSRVSILDEEDGSYTASAYLIAQLGKNYAIDKERRIEGKELLSLAMQIIKSMQYAVGGMLEFLECEDNPFLLSFYGENGFKPFATRQASDGNGNAHTLHQLLKFI